MLNPSKQDLIKLTNTVFPIIVMLIIDTFETVRDPAKVKQIKWFNNNSRLTNLMGDKSSK